MKTTSHMDLLPQSLGQQELSRTPSPQNTLNASGRAQSSIKSNLSAILNAVKSNSSTLVAEAKTRRNSSPKNDSKSVENDVEQQKGFHHFTSSLNDLGFHSSFPVNVFPPFFATLQQNPSTLHHQLMSLGAENCSGLSPSLDDDDDLENVNSTEPEDLTIGYRKNKRDGDDNEDSDVSVQHNWSYEEQFKQAACASSEIMHKAPIMLRRSLYELSDDVKRKEWLDDWLGFMHRIGKPVTRIPIMAKQVLDLYELYKLVVQHGGLVEIINKKLWREITKGLNLPSSITSAAFTLRTQYQKFLYDYECEKESLSSPSDLQQAIDGNRREGRRNPTASAGFPQLNYPVAAGASGLLSKHLNGSLNLCNGLDDEIQLRSTIPQQAALVAAYRAEQYAALEAQQRQFERAQRAAADAVARHSLNASGVSGRESTSSVDSDGNPPTKRTRQCSSATATNNDENNSIFTNHNMDRLFAGMPSAHLKIANRKDGHNMDESLVVSMEINGVMYQGVLFAIHGNSKSVPVGDNTSSLNLSNSMRIAL